MRIYATPRIPSMHAESQEPSARHVALFRVRYHLSSKYQAVPYRVSTLYACNSYQGVYCHIVTPLAGVVCIIHFLGRKHGSTRYTTHACEVIGSQLLKA